jgi:excinuclease ABC subunit A
LDEPTTGLHFDDINKLLKVLKKFVAMGNTVVVIEHNLDVIKSADWIIDLGPEGGAKGGYILTTGTPEDIIACKASATGEFLKIHYDREMGYQEEPKPKKKKRKTSKKE